MTSKERELAIDIFEDNFTVIDTHGHYTEEEECLAIDMAIEALEQEPCEDAISRQAVQDYIAKYLSQYLYEDVRQAVEVIDEYIGELPSVNPQEPILDKIIAEIEHMACRQYEYKLMLDREDVLKVFSKYIGE